jgi:DNA end-binding protein Ku
MGARAVANIKIVFGTFNFGAQAYICGDTESIKTNMISAKTKNKLQQKFIDSKTLEEVPNEDRAKGVPNESGAESGDSFIQITDEDMKSLQSKSDIGTLQIDEFISLNEISSVCVEKNYYLTPDKGQDQKYLLLTHLLKTNKSLGIGKWHTNGKEKLVCIRFYDGGLVMSNLFYSKEFRPFDKNCDKDLQLPQETIEQANIIFKMLVKPKFDHSKYMDSVPEKFDKMVQQKTFGNIKPDLKTEPVIELPKEKVPEPVDVTIARRVGTTEAIKDNFGKAIDTLASIFSRKTG